MKLRNQTSILFMKKIAYVLNFPLKLVLLTWLESKVYR